MSFESLEDIIKGKVNKLYVFSFCHNYVFDIILYFVFQTTPRKEKL